MIYICNTFNYYQCKIQCKFNLTNTINFLALFVNMYFCFIFNALTTLWVLSGCSLSAFWPRKMTALDKYETNEQTDEDQHFLGSCQSQKMVTDETLLTTRFSLHIKVQRKYFKWNRNYMLQKKVTCIICYFHQIPFVLLHLEWFFLLQMYFMLTKNVNLLTFFVNMIYNWNRNN